MCDLDEKAMAVFNDVVSKPFPQQCVFFLNQFWAEFRDQAEFIYSIATPLFRMSDMHAKKIEFLHLYKDGKDLDFDITLHYFTNLTKFYESPTTFHKDLPQLENWAAAHAEYKATYDKSRPPVTSTQEYCNTIAFKKEFKHKLDLNGDGVIAFLEILLFQYKCSAKELIARYIAKDDEPAEIVKARQSLEEVNQAISAFEGEKQRLTADSELPGIKGKCAINELAQLNAGPLMDKLNSVLLHAEADVRAAVKKYGRNGPAEGPNEGALWWMERELQDKKEKYSKK